MVFKLVDLGVDAFFTASYAKAAPPDAIETFATRAETELKTFVYKASNETTKTPILLLFFGGGWRHGNSWQLAAIGRQLATLGITTYLPEYRVASRHGASINDAISDVDACFNWIIQQRPHNSIILGGSSAGGFLAASVAMTAAQKPKALVLINPALNLSERRLQRVWPLLGQPKESSIGQFRKLDPMRLLSENTSATLILHGDKDLLVPLESVEEFVGRSLSLGNNVRIRVFHGYGHGFGSMPFYPKAQRSVVREIQKFICEIAGDTKSPD